MTVHIKRNRGSAHRWRWICTTSIPRGLRTETCGAWGLADSEEEAGRKADEHTTAVHGATAPGGRP